MAASLGDVDGSRGMMVMTGVVVVVVMVLGDGGEKKEIVGGNRNGRRRWNEQLRKRSEGRGESGGGRR